MEPQINIDNICRLCLRVKIPGMILLEINEMQQIKFEEITSSELVLEAGYPSKCCSECRDQLENFFFYKNQLLRKQEELLQVLNVPAQHFRTDDYNKCLEENEQEEEQNLEFVLEEEMFVDEVVEDVDESLETKDPDVDQDAKTAEEDEETAEPFIETEEVNMETAEIDEDTSEPDDDAEEVFAVVEEDIEYEETYEALEELESDNEVPASSKVPRLEKVKFEKVEPLLVLTPNFLKARENLKKFPISEASSNFDYTIVEDDAGTKFFICNDFKCNLEFSSKEEIKLHLRDHKFDTDRKKCPKCPQTFKSRHFYEKHIETAHGEILHICQTCGKIFDTRIQLRSHLRNHDQTLKYKCSYEGCQKAFRVKHHLDNHLRGHTKESPFACDFEGCSARFRQKHALTIHMRKHNGNFLACEKCNSPFVTKFNLQKHLQKCNGVFRPLKTRAASRTKTDSESSSEIYRCCVTDCMEGFKSKVTLEKHLVKTHDIFLTPTTCILCCLEFSTPQALKSHLRHHLPFTCQLCSLSFKNKETYETHIKIHDGNEVRVHHCVECQASFKRAEHLKTHIAYKHNSDQSEDS